VGKNRGTDTEGKWGSSSRLHEVVLVCAGGTGKIPEGEGKGRGKAALEHGQRVPSGGVFTVVHYLAARIGGDGAVGGGGVKGRQRVWLT